MRFPTLVPRRGWFCAVLMGTLVACGGEEGVGRSVDAAGHGEPASVDRVTAERIVGEYFEALLQGRTADARSLLATGPRSDAFDETMLGASREIAGRHVRTVEAVEVEDARMVFRVELAAATAVDLRWVEVEHERRGWRIARVADAPIEPMDRPRASLWTQVNLLEADLALEVPHGWAREAPHWRWAPADGRREVEVGWGGPDPRWRPESVVPVGAEVLRAAPIALEWGDGVEFTVRLPGRSDASSFGHELHVAARAAATGRTLHLVGRARSAGDLATLRPVVGRIARSIEMHVPASLTTQDPGRTGEPRN